MTRADSHRLILLSGIGADGRLLEPQQRRFPHLEVPAWIPERARESLSDYAARLVATVDPGGPCIVGGVSFGGAVALEMARHLPVRGVILIASCRSRRGIARKLRAVEFLSRPMAAGLVDFGRIVSPLVIGRSKQVDSATRKLLLEMVARTPTSFLRWGCRAMCQWDGAGALDVRIHQIHGARDPVLPARWQPADVRISDGGHLINLTHAAAVNEFIAACLHDVAINHD